MSFATLPSEYRTDGAVLLSLSRNIGASLGISVVSFLLARNIQISHADLAGHITAFNLPTDPNTALRFGQSGDSAMAMLDGEIHRQAAVIPYLNDLPLLMWVTRSEEHTPELQSTMH